MVKRHTRGTTYNPPPHLRGAPLTSKSSTHALTFAHCDMFLVFHESFVFPVEVQLLFSLGIVSTVIGTTNVRVRIPCTNV